MREIGKGGISAAIQFLCLFPLGMYMDMAMRHWNLVKEHAGILLGPPLSHKIQVGEQFGGPWVRSVRSLYKEIANIFRAPSRLFGTLSCGHLQCGLQARYSFSSESSTP
jgi:hypothetical protein